MASKAGCVVSICIWELESLFHGSHFPRPSLAREGTSCTSQLRFPGRQIWHRVRAQEVCRGILGVQCGWKRKAAELDRGRSRSVTQSQGRFRLNPTGSSRVTPQSHPESFVPEEISMPPCGHHTAGKPCWKSLGGSYCSWNPSFYC